MSYLSDMADWDVPQLRPSSSITYGGAGVFFKDDLSISILSPSHVEIAIKTGANSSRSILLDADDWFRQMQRLQHVLESAREYPVAREIEQT